MRETGHHDIDRRRFIVGGSALALAGASGFAPRLAKRATAKEGAGFFARPNGNRGELLGYSLETGHQIVALPPGILPPAGWPYVAAEATSRSASDDRQSIVSEHGRALFSAIEAGAPSDSAPKNTLVSVYDPFTGRRQDGWIFDGTWRLGGTSAAGRWVALTSVPTDAERDAWTATDSWQTEVMLVDSGSSFADPRAGDTRRITLDGNFEVEVVSANGEVLFLIEHLPPANPDRYLVRLYDNAIGGLQPGALRDKRTKDEFMAGLAWDGVASPDGRWLLTLYLNATREVAFVHSLNLIERYPVCIDLPSGTGDFSLLKQYGLHFSPTGRELYAANTALGVVAHVDLENFEVASSATFAPAPPPAKDVKGANSRVAMRSDGSALFFTGGEDVWSYNTASRAIAGPMTVAGPIIGLGMAPNDHDILVARAGEPLLALDPATGTATSLAPGDA